jgi:hypothetical protein
VNDNQPPLVVGNNGVNRTGTRGSKLVLLLLAVMLVAAVGAVLVMMSL